METFRGLPLCPSQPPFANYKRRVAHEGFILLFSNGLLLVNLGPDHEEIFTVQVLNQKLCLEGVLFSLPMVIL